MGVSFRWTKSLKLDRNDIDEHRHTEPRLHLPKVNSYIDRNTAVNRFDHSGLYCGDDGSNYKKKNCSSFIILFVISGGCDAQTLRCVASIAGRLSV